MALRNIILIGIIIVIAALTAIMIIKQIPKRKIIRRLLSSVGIIISVILILAVIVFPGLSNVRTTGSYSYRSIVLELIDQSRIETFINDGSFRKLSIIAYYPEGNSIELNSCPLIVFSHGGISVKTSNVSLYEELASHGYVVVSIDHTYHSLYTTIDGKKITIDPEYLKELNREDSHQDIANSYNHFVKWMSLRTDDINFVLDTIIEESQLPNNGFYSLINTEKIGLMGHSLGGAAALGTARQRDDISAVIALESPYLYDITGYSNGNFTWNDDPYDCAIMNIYSDAGYQLIGNDHKYVKNLEHLINEGRIAYYYIEGSNHFSLTDLVRTSPILTRFLGGSYIKPGYDTLKYINEIVLEFYNEYLDYNQTIG